jgi:hypothetical protein
VFRTNRHAKNFKLIQIDLEQPAESSWVDLVPEHRWSLAKTSVGDPNPQDPHVFGSPGSISQRYGSGSGSGSGSVPFPINVLSSRTSISSRQVPSNVGIRIRSPVGWTWCQSTGKNKSLFGQKKAFFGILRYLYSEENLKVVNITHVSCAFIKFSSTSNLISYTVLWIRVILVRIRIRGSILLTYGSGF